MPIYEKDENGQIYLPDDPFYLLNGYFKRGDLLPDYLDFTLPRTKQKQKEYYNKLLAIRYFFFLDYKNRMDEPDAAGYSDLSDPLLFALAKTQYGIIQLNKITMLPTVESSYIIDTSLLQGTRIARPIS